MIITNGQIILWAGTKALPALWSWWVAHTMTRAQIVGKYCPPATELPAGMTDFQKTQYEKQCGQVGTYIFQVQPVKPAVPAEQIGPPEPTKPAQPEPAEQKP